LLANRTYGDPDFNVSATASSGLTVSFAASGNCTIGGTTVHITGAGSCTVTASQAGDSTYNAAPNVSRSFTIAKANQTITVITHAPFGAIYGTGFSVAAGGGASGNPIVYSSSGSCSSSGSAFTMTSGSGYCTVEYDQSGNGNYNAAPSVSESVVALKSSQTIVFGPLANRRYGDPDFSLSATASSGLVVSFVAGGSCTVSGSTVHLTGAGSCTLTASQPGDANYNPAPGVQQSFTIQAAQTPPSCTVPRVVGKTLATAKLIIKRRHCRTGTVRYAYSRPTTKGKVISQSRRPGRVLPVNATINLLVGRGPKR
jgi:PASTA domain